MYASSNKENRDGPMASACMGTRCGDSDAPSCSLDSQTVVNLVWALVKLDLIQPGSPSHDLIMSTEPLVKALLPQIIAQVSKNPSL